MSMTVLKSFSCVVLLFPFSCCWIYVCFDAGGRCERPNASFAGRAGSHEAPGPHCQLCGAILHRPQTAHCKSLTIIFVHDYLVKFHFEVGKHYSLMWTPDIKREEKQKVNFNVEVIILLLILFLLMICMTVHSLPWKLVLMEQFCWSIAVMDPMYSYLCRMCAII